MILTVIEEDVKQLRNLFAVDDCQKLWDLFDQLKLIVRVDL
jgi:hypothetical protein